MVPMVPMLDDYKHRFAGLVRVLFASKGKVASKEVLRAWWMALCDVPVDEFESAMTDEIRGSHEFPNPGRIRDIVQKKSKTVKNFVSLLPDNQDKDYKFGSAIWEPGKRLVIGDVEMRPSETICPRCAIKPLVCVNGKDSVICGQCLTDLVWHQEIKSFDEYGNTVFTLVEKFNEAGQWGLPYTREISKTIYRKQKVETKKDNR